MSKLRGFIALETKIPKKISNFQNEIIKTGANIKLVKPENMHLTIKFLGETEELQINNIEEIIKKAIIGVKPFKIKLKGTGAFPNHDYIKIIWIGIENGEIIKTIAEKINNDLSKIGFKKDKKNFSPHLTIGRVKTAKNKEKIIKILDKNKDIFFSEQEINTIKLIKSKLTPKGPIYTTLKELKF